MRLHYLQHVPFEGLGLIETWAAKAHHDITATRLYAHEALPRLESFDLLVIMGGPMGAQDDAKFPWMKGEKRFLDEAIARKKKILGICLGAQLLANVLGAKVYRNPQKEIGWYPIDLTMANLRQHPLNVLPSRPTVFHWHGDTFELPKGALHLAKSAACENQAFSVGDHVMGLQFHLEMGLKQIESILRHASADLSPGTYVMNSEEMVDLAPSHVPPLNAALVRFLDAFSHGA